MKGFKQWLMEKEIELNEKGKRTALSANYPSLYHSQRQQPRQTWTPISATAPLADKQIGPDEKVKDGGPNVSDEKDNPYKSFYQTEGSWGKHKKKKYMHTGNKPWMKTTEHKVEGLTEMAKGKKSQPVVMPKKDDGPMTIDAGIGRTHNTHLAAFRTGAHKNKRAFNKSDRNKSKAALRNAY